MTTLLISIKIINGRKQNFALLNIVCGHAAFNINTSPIFKCLPARKKAVRYCLFLLFIYNFIRYQLLQLPP
jgi:hypothetical protein